MYPESKGAGQSLSQPARRKFRQDICLVDVTAGMFSENTGELAIVVPS